MKNLKLFTLIIGLLPGVLDLNRAGALGGFVKQDVMDIDSYVTKRAMDGPFKMVADEKKRIRENPVARTTDLLQKVFGSATK